jgi:hypothetical protein
VLEDGGSRRREANGAATGREERLADLALERCDLLRDGRRGEVKRVGGGRDRAAAGDLSERAQAPELDHVAELTDMKQKV